MEVAWQDLIDRARTYVDDDHKDTEGWIDPARWLTFAGLEYTLHYNRWVRSGLLCPAPVDTTFTGPSKNLEGVLAVVGVAELTSSGAQYRPLHPLQATDGRAPFRTPLDTVAVGWEAYGSGDVLTVQLRPEDTTGSYVVRHIPRPERPTDPADTVELPDFGDERIVLGMARRAGVKESASSVPIRVLIDEADAELAFQASGKLPRGPRGRNSDRYARTAMRSGFPTDPRFWRYV